MRIGVKGMSDFSKPNENTASARLHSIRGAFFRNASLTTEHDFTKGISLKEGGCLLPPPEHVMRAMQHTMFDFVQFPYHLYPDQNISELFLDDIRKYFEESCGIKQSAQAEVSIGFGSSHIFDGVLSAVCKPDNILLAPAAFYHSFADWPVKWGSSLEWVETDKNNGHKLMASELRAWLEMPENKDKEVGALLLWNPGTTGALYTKQELEELAEVIREYDLLVYCDEVFRDTEFKDKKTISLGSLPDMDKHVITATSGSKNRSVANFRIGWGTGPKHIMDKVNHYMDFTITDVPLYLQHIGRAILNTSQGWLDEARDEYAVRADLIETLVDKTNQDLNAHFNTKAVSYISIPYAPEAGHYTMLNMDALKGFKAPSGQTIEDGHDLTFFFYDPNKDQDPTKSVAFSSGYSKGHDDLSLYIAFAQLGYEQVSNLLSPIMKQRLLGNAANENSADDEVVLSMSDSAELKQAYQAGHGILVEAFNRVSASIKSLEPSRAFKQKHGLQQTSGPSSKDLKL